MEDRIVRIICRFIVPFIQVYGIYIILHGHISPGGGFAGGAIVGASIVLFALAFNLSESSKKIPESTASLLESGGALGYALVGLLAILMGGSYLSNKAAGFGMGIPGTIFSAGTIPVITIFIGIKVTSTIVTFFYHLVEGEEKEHGSHSEADR